MAKQTLSEKVLKLFEAEEKIEDVVQAFDDVQELVARKLAAYHKVRQAEADLVMKKIESLKPKQNGGDIQS